MEANGFAGVHDDGRLGIHSEQPAVLSREESVALAMAVLRQQGMLAQLDERRALYDNLAATQRRCKELLEENRRLERENSERGLALLDLLQTIGPFRKAYTKLYEGVGSDDWIRTRRAVGHALNVAHERVQRALGLEVDEPIQWR